MTTKSHSDLMACIICRKEEEPWGDRQEPDGYKCFECCWKLALEESSKLCNNIMKKLADR